jgi:hypothetical protein
VAKQSRVRVCGQSLAGVVASLNPARGVDVCVVCCRRTKGKKPGQSGQKLDRPNRWATPVVLQLSDLGQNKITS